MQNKCVCFCVKTRIMNWNSVCYMYALLTEVIIIIIPYMCAVFFSFQSVVFDLPHSCVSVVAESWQDGYMKLSECSQLPELLERPSDFYQRMRTNDRGNELKYNVYKTGKGAIPSGLFSTGCCKMEVCVFASCLFVCSCMQLVSRNSLMKQHTYVACRSRWSLYTCMCMQSTYYATSLGLQSTVLLGLYIGRLTHGRCT